MTKDIGWRTINGTHVYLSGKGTIMKGPTSLVGQKASDLKNANGKLIYTQPTVSLMSAQAEYKKMKKEAEKVKKENARAKAKKREYEKYKEEQARKKAEGVSDNPNPTKATKNSATPKTTTSPQLKTSGDTKMYGGYEIPKEYLTPSGALKKAYQADFNKQVRKDPTKAVSHHAIQNAFADDFNKAGIKSKEIMWDTAGLMKKGDSFEVALKKAIEIDQKFNS